MARKLDRIVEPAYTDAMAQKDENKRAVREQRICPPLGVPIRNGHIDMASSAVARQYPQLAGLGMTLGSGQGQVLPTPPSAVVGQFAMRPPIPAANSLRDTEYTIKNGQAAKR